MLDREMSEDDSMQLDFKSADKTFFLAMPLSKPHDSEKSTQGSASSHCSQVITGTAFVMLETSEQGGTPNMEVENVSLETSAPSVGKTLPQASVDAALGEIAGVNTEEKKHEPPKPFSSGGGVALMG